MQSFHVYLYRCTVIIYTNYYNFSLVNIFQITLHLAQRVTAGLFYQSLHHHLGTARPSTCDSRDISAISQGQILMCAYDIYVE